MRPMGPEFWDMSYRGGGSIFFGVSVVDIVGEENYSLLEKVVIVINSKGSVPL